MPDDPTPDPRRRSRPGAAGRRVALGLSPELGPDRAIPAVEVLPRTGDGGAGSEPSDVEDDARQLPSASRRRPPAWRRVLFALTVVVLVIAIPALGFVGYRLLSNSTDGRLTARSNKPSDPGYEAQVELTPTAVVIQYNAEHLPVGATFLSLSSSEGGGAVIFVPLDIDVLVPNIGPGPLQLYYQTFSKDPGVARDRFATKVGELLNVGIQEVVEVDNAEWETLVNPVGPLRFDNPEVVTLAGGVVIGAGSVQLAADQVGPYLAVHKPGETELAHLARNQLVWKAWIGQVATAGPGSVPGETTTGIGRFVTALAKGSVSYNTLPVVSTSAGPNRLRIDPEAVSNLVTDAVPSPTAARPGSRFTVRLLNGVSAAPIPRELTRDLVRAGGTVTVIGNGPRLGQDETTLVYGDRSKAGLAKLVLKTLGGQGRTRFDQEAPDTLDLTIVLGKDILGTPASVSTTSSGGSIAAETSTTSSPQTTAGSTETTDTTGFGTGSGTTEGN